MNRRARAIFILIGVMAMWGSTFVVTKGVIDDLPPLALAFVRVAIGFALLLPFAWPRYRRIAGAGQRLPWGTIALMAFVGVAFYYGAFNLALVYTSASQGALVQSSIPAVTALVAVVWLRESASTARLIGIALSVFGILVIFAGNEAGGAASRPMLGNVLMFVSVVAWGFYTSMAKRLADVDAVVLTTGVIGGGALMLLPVAAFELAGQPLPQLGAAAWLKVVFLGAGASGLAYMLYNLALQEVDASQAGVFANLIPVVGVITGILVLHEPLSVQAMIGGLIVMAGVWVTSSRAAG